MQNRKTVHRVIFTTHPYVIANFCATVFRIASPTPRQTVAHCGGGGAKAESKNYSPVPLVALLLDRTISCVYVRACLSNIKVLNTPQLSSTTFTSMAMCTALALWWSLQLRLPHCPGMLGWLCRRSAVESSSSFVIHSVCGDLQGSVVDPRNRYGTPSSYPIAYNGDLIRARFALVISGNIMRHFWQLFANCSSSLAPVVGN